MAKDRFHDCVKAALVSDGWSITHDPFNLSTKRRGEKKIIIPIDLGAERIFTAERNGEKIAVEVKSFLRSSVINEFHRAIGQYLVYRLGIKSQEPTRKLFLAVPARIMQEIEELDLLHDSLNEYVVKILIFDPQKCTIVGWIK